MPDTQEDESLGTEQLPQTELDSTPGIGEESTSDAEARRNPDADRPPAQSNQPHGDNNNS